MARPGKLDERRRELLPLIARAFSELGYRRATTAELAARCNVRENILYRLWPDKKAMFVASIDYLFVRRMENWNSALENETLTGQARLNRLIELTSHNLGEQGLYRIIFAALTETDDADVKQALTSLYHHYHQRVLTEISRQRDPDAAPAPEDEQTAWGLIGLVAFMNIVIDLDLMSALKRSNLFSSLALQLLGNLN